MRDSLPAKAVVKTMRIIECLARERSFGISEITRLVSAGSGGERMNKSTVYRFLTSLAKLGFVRQEPETGRYGLTLKLFEIGTSALERLELSRESEPVLKEVARLTGETVQLATLEESRIVSIGKIESTRTLRVSMASRVGKAAPTYCTALGKTLLAYLPSGRADEVLSGERLVRWTEKTITRRQDLDRELAAIRERGSALDDEENERGVRCVAAPVRNNKGEVCAAVSISVPAVRLPNKEISRYRRIVVRAALDISARMGFRAESSPRGLSADGRRPTGKGMARGNRSLTRRV